MTGFTEFFTVATTFPPFDYQGRLAGDPHAPTAILDGPKSLTINVPTGAGKTAAVVLAWLWNRCGHPDAEHRSKWPRRLVYCLPMRVLVEQTAKNARTWVATLLNGDLLNKDVPVHVLMGGEATEDWDLYPDREAILVGTQDMLLSRALNRGYAASRARWPIQFGLLNTDSLWVFDEIQLMGAGLATTSQLEAFRNRLGSQDGHGCRTIWMSATLRQDWLRTVDFDPILLDKPIQLTVEDFRIKEIEKRWKARKSLIRANSVMGDTTELAKEVLACHRQGTRTIIVVNTVRRACELFEALEKHRSERKGRDTRDEKKPHTVLLHSRFRPVDRERQVEMALADPRDGGTIVISTQVIEAGVDVSATTLFTELATWASLVQRFGRCNRRGDDNDAKVFWIGLPDDGANEAKLALPYEPNQVKASAKQLATLSDVGLNSLPEVPLTFQHSHVIRRKDLIDLFDTTPDLAGSDIDIDRFVREIEESDVQVCWRDWERRKENEKPSEEEASPRREELCRAPIGEFREFVKAKTGQVWCWMFREREWRRAEPNTIAPGQVFLIHSEAGGYESNQGWSEKSNSRVDPVSPWDPGANGPPDSTDDDPPSRIDVWQTIAQHTDDLVDAIDSIIQALAMMGTAAEALRVAARWHDRGKAHSVFQEAVDDGQVQQRPQSWRGCQFVAKAPDKRKNRKGEIIDTGFWRKYARKHFRHELASALAVLDPRNNLVSEDLRDLVAYLVAAHHGKVRLSIRSLPGEIRPLPDDTNSKMGRRFARGVWDGDRLPVTDLGGGVIAPEVALSLEPMELGLCAQSPFAGQPSWIERMIGLRDTLGPFCLAYLEAVLRAADMRASRTAEQRAAARQSEESGQ